MFSSMLDNGDDALFLTVTFTVAFLVLLADVLNEAVIVAVPFFTPVILNEAAFLPFFTDTLLGTLATLALLDLRVTFKAFVCFLFKVTFIVFVLPTFIVAFLAETVILLVPLTALVAAAPKQFSVGTDAMHKIVTSKTARNLVRLCLMYVSPFKYRI